MNWPGALVVFAAALGTALATGLGAGPFLFAGRLARSRVGLTNALAGGFMFAASALLFYTGARENTWRMVIGGLLGVLFVAWVSRLPQGMGVVRAAGWSVFSSLPQPLVAVPAFLFVSFFDGMVPIGLGFAGGAMLWMVAAQVVPGALATSSRRAVALALVASTAAMLTFEAVLLA